MVLNFTIFSVNQSATCRYANTALIYNLIIVSPTESENVQLKSDVEDQKREILQFKSAISLLHQDVNGE